MGYHGSEHLNRIYREATRYEFYPPCSLSSNVYNREAGEHKSLFRSDQIHPTTSQKLEMYSMPMPSIFNFHLKVDEAQQHQFQVQQGPSNGMFLKKEVQVNAHAQGQLIPPVAHTSSQPIIITHGQGHAPNVPPPVEDNFVLEHHVKIDKTAPKPYTCNYCAKVYKQLMGIKNHVKTHLQANNEALLNCSVCGKATSCRNPVSKPFVCTSCRDVKSQLQQQQHHNTHLAQQQQLMQHSGIVVYHQGPQSPSKASANQNNCREEEEDCPESEKQYQCQYCNKRFQHPSTLKMHLKKHTDDKPFICEYCNKNFKRNSSLKIHARTHTGEKTHECTYCGKLFAYEVFLKVHLRKHTGEKPYACSACDKTFTQAGNLKSHMKRKHLIGV